MELINALNSKNPYDPVNRNCFRPISFSSVTVKSHADQAKNNM